MTSEKPTIRSFVMRQGRLTKSQQHALDYLWEKHGIDSTDQPINLKDHFKYTEQPITLEIGFGNGQTLIEMAQAQPQQNFLGIEVHPPGVGQILNAIEVQGLSNLKVMKEDASEVLKYCIEDHSLARIQIFFPDPWHKKKHHKRRLIQTEFLTLLYKKMIPGGLLHLATDWADYAEHMAEVLTAHPHFEPQTPKHAPFTPKPDFRPETKFERRGLNLGHKVFDLLYVTS